MVIWKVSIVFLFSSSDENVEKGGEGRGGYVPVESATARRAAEVVALCIIMFVVVEFEFPSLAGPRRDTRWRAGHRRSRTRGDQRKSLLHTRLL